MNTLHLRKEYESRELALLSNSDSFNHEENGAFVVTLDVFAVDEDRPMAFALLNVHGDWGNQAVLKDTARRVALMMAQPFLLHVHRHPHDGESDTVLDILTIRPTRVVLSDLSRAEHKDAFGNPLTCRTITVHQRAQVW